jgi:hypothetical protein
MEDPNEGIVCGREMIPVVKALVKAMNMSVKIQSIAKYAEERGIQADAKRVELEIMRRIGQILYGPSPK